MDGVSGAFAVVSLAIQLFETVQETRKFLNDIQNAPNEIIKQIETLDQLSSVLGYVKQLLEQQLIVLRLPGSPIFILNALQNCERKLKPLEEIITGAKKAGSHEHRARRQWSSLRFVSKKDQLQEIHSQLRDAKSDLQFSISANSWQLQMHHLQIANEKAPLYIDDKQTRSSTYIRNDITGSTPQTGQSANASAVKPWKQPSPFVQETETRLYKGIFGIIRFDKKSKRSNHCANTRSHQSDISLEEDLYLIKPSFLRRGFELRFCNSFGRISRSLSIYPVITADDPVFKMCQKGDIDGLQSAISRGSFSPFVLDNAGRTLLHVCGYIVIASRIKADEVQYAAMYFHSNLCSWLLQLGVDPDRSADYGQTALQRVAIPGVCNEYGGDLSSFEKPIIDTLRILLQAQDDFTLSDVRGFSNLYHGPPAGVEFLLLQDETLVGDLDQDAREKAAYAFAGAVSLFGEGFRQWENLIRKLIREGVNIHGQVRHFWYQSWNERESHGFLDIPDVPGTPLDDLFIRTKTPSEARAVANIWLQILESEGYDAVTYLKEEVALHEPQQHLTWSDFDCYRKLIFQLGENPGVWWDWQLEPESGAIMVREEYKSLNLAMDIDDFLVRGDWVINDDEIMILQSAMWPWGYIELDWGLDSSDAIYSEWKRKKNLARSRADRRLAKRVSKHRRALGLKNVARMPGAWPI